MIAQEISRDDIAVVEEGKILLVFSEKEQFNTALESLGLGTIEKKESGEPYFSGSSHHISISHKGDVVVAAISRAQVGVDVENVTIPRNVERLSRLFHVSEAPESLYDFYKVWTAKEAMGKLLGTGITTDLLKEPVKAVRHIDFGDYLVAIAGEGEISVREIL